MGPAPNTGVSAGPRTAVTLALLCDGVLLVGDVIFTLLRDGEDKAPLSPRRAVGAGRFAPGGELCGFVLGDANVNRRARRVYTPRDAQHDIRR